MATEKRKHRAYKIVDAAYNKAMKRAQKNKTPLSNIVENIVTSYGEGYLIEISIRKVTTKK